MATYEFNGKILIAGFGSIGQGVLPLILRHFSVPPERVAVVTADARGEAVAKEYGVSVSTIKDIVHGRTWNKPEHFPR